MKMVNVVSVCILLLWSRLQPVQLGKEKFIWFIHIYHNPSLREAQAGSQAGQEPKAEIIEEHCLLVSSL